MAKSKLTPAERQAIKDSITALGLASESGDLPTMKQILKQYPEAVRNWKPITYAAAAGQPKALKLLLERGANPNQIGSPNCPNFPLHRAVEHHKTAPKHNGHDEVVRQLIEAGGDVTRRQGWDGCTPIDVAARGGEGRFLPLLLKEVKSPGIFLAAVIADDKRVAALLKGDRSLAKATDAFGWTPLHHCAASRLGANDEKAAARLRKIAEMLLAAGADAEAPDTSKWKRTPLYLATDNKAVTDVLLAAGTSDPTKALWRAIHNGQIDGCETLLAAGGDVRDKEIVNLLPSRVRWGRAAVVQWAVEHGAEANGRDEFGRTILHWACSRGLSVEFVTAMLEQGGDVNAKDNAGATPLAIAKQKKRGKLIELLKAVGAR